MWIRTSSDMFSLKFGLTSREVTREIKLSKIASNSASEAESSNASMNTGTVDPIRDITLLITFSNSSYSLDLADDIFRLSIEKN